MCAVDVVKMDTHHLGVSRKEYSFEPQTERSEFLRKDLYLSGNMVKTGEIGLRKVPK